MTTSGNDVTTSTFTTMPSTTMSSRAITTTTIKQLESPLKNSSKGKEKMTFQPDYSSNNPFLKKLEGKIFTKYLIIYILYFFCFFLLKLILIFLILFKSIR